uniref:NADH-ubiquinone oxidoreductase chain 4L n=1 Tax=Mesenchytraeus cf. pedatus SL-2017 TaxID=2052678 RepID=A0A286KAW3_9ANNE|nr:NADH dehydrogenase subunit 4L [Mesenchytraeus cf. pedatus SL-2017]
MNYSLIVFTQLAIYAMIMALLIQRSHFLMSLLCLEGIMLSTVLFIPIMMYSMSLILPTISIIMLTFGACEASLGLSLLVKMSRSYGSDMMSSLSTNKC